VNESTLTDGLFDPEPLVVFVLLDDDFEDEPHAVIATTVPTAATPCSARRSATLMQAPIRDAPSMGGAGDEMTVRLYPRAPAFKHRGAFMEGRRLP
jgi:hypothetical protein